MKRRRIRWAALAGLGIAWGAWAQEPPEVPPPAPAEIEALREQVRILSDQLNSLETRYAADQASTEEAAKAAEEEAKTAPIVTAGREGFSLRSSDGQFQLRIRGIILHDFAAFSQDGELERAIGEEQKGTGFRAARLRVQGKLYDTISFNADYDFAGQTGAIRRSSEIPSPSLTACRSSARTPSICGWATSASRSAWRT